MEAALNRIVDENTLSKDDQEKMRKNLKAVANAIIKLALPFGVTVDRIVKGGSWKKGTILKMKNDVDLVVFLNCEFAAYVDEVFTGQIIKAIANRLRVPGVRILRETSFVVSIEYNGTLFDILTAFNAVTDSKSKQDKIKSQRENFAALLLSRPDLKPYYYSTSVSESSREIITMRDNNTNKLTRAIKLAKIWNKKYFSNDDGKHKNQLRSYALEIIMAKLFDMYRTDPKLSGPFLFYQMLALFSVLDYRKQITVSLTDFRIPVWDDPRARYLRVLDPCISKSDVVSDFKNWDYLIRQAKVAKEHMDHGIVRFLQ